jgi:hypothetical protein
MSLTSGFIEPRRFDFEVSGKRNAGATKEPAKALAMTTSVHQWAYS